MASWDLWRNALTGATSEWRMSSNYSRRQLLASAAIAASGIAAYLYAARHYVAVVPALSSALFVRAFW